jgi:hypothetical protein
VTHTFGKQSAQQIVDRRRFVRYQCRERLKRVITSPTDVLDTAAAFAQLSKGGLGPPNRFIHRIGQQHVDFVSKSHAAVSAAQSVGLQFGGVSRGSVPDEGPYAKLAHRATDYKSKACAGPQICRIGRSDKGHGLPNPFSLAVQTDGLKNRCLESTSSKIRMCVGVEYVRNIIIHSKIGIERPKRGRTLHCPTD